MEPKHQEEIVLQEAVVAQGEALFAAMKNEKPGLFDKKYWQGRLMEYVLQDPEFKVDLFRLVDVLPVCFKNEQIAKHVQEYLMKEGRTLPSLVGSALKVASFGPTAWLAYAAIKKNVVDMAERFIIGTDLAHAKKNLIKLYEEGFAATVDLLGEATLSEEEALKYSARYQSLIENLPAFLQSHKSLSSDLENFYRPNVSIKASALSPKITSLAPNFSAEKVYERLVPLFILAKHQGVFLNVDLEQWSVHETTYDVFRQLIHHPELKNWSGVGMVVQAYLHSAEKDLHNLIKWSKERGQKITVRLVKGAYWDYESVTAQLHGINPPVFLNKSQTDANYEYLSRMLFDNIEYVTPALGSHNLRSLSHGIVYAQKRGIRKDRFEIQMLYGMAEPERKVLHKMGHLVRVYAPIGDLLPGMAYLVRRLLENTSNVGFLRLSQEQDVDVPSLLAKPETKPEDSKPAPKKSGFQGCPATDFTVEAERIRFQNSLALVEKAMPYQVPIVINGNLETAQIKKTRFCPSQSTQVFSEVSLASISHAEKAIVKSQDAMEMLRATSVSQRAQWLRDLAQQLLLDRSYLAALMCVEVGKAWAESDADVVEAIDFCNYYAERALIELSPEILGDLAGEKNILITEGRGPTIIIAPWNFPLAILTGMATAALAAGNPIILKPSELSSSIAYELYKKMMKAGIPKEAVHFLPGRGEEIGSYLISHPLLAQIAFTGSCAVGLQILAKANVVTKGQKVLRKIVCEMGGKNAIIVDDDADVDEAILGALQSAFSYSGQKCSAASRIILLESICAPFLKRLIEAVQSLEIGPATLPQVFFGPVVDEEAQMRLLNVIEKARKDAQVETLFIGKAPRGGYFVPPALFRVKDADHWLMQEELFGPILAIMSCPDLKEAVKIANHTDFALTGGFYSRSPVNIEYVRREFRVGNLYINQKCTGAMVSRQPFGGFHMSGLGTKAGGPGYVHNFVDMRVITENTMRRGFTPDIE